MVGYRRYHYPYGSKRIDELSMAQIMMLTYGFVYFKGSSLSDEQRKAAQ